jgi:hypothetical protein
LSAKDPYQKICKFPGCGTTFTAKRLNQDYHTPECKKKANNGIAANERKLMKQVDDALKRNRRVLEWFFLNNRKVVELSDLMSAGMDLSKHTSRGKDKNGNFSLPEFYNYSIEKITETQFKIIKLW